MSVQRFTSLMTRCPSTQYKRATDSCSMFNTTIAMKLSNLIVCPLLSASTCLAHWNYDRIIVNGEIIGSPYEYVRKTNNSNYPLQDVNSIYMRCNSGAESGVAINTKTYTVAAGDMLGLFFELELRRQRRHPQMGNPQRANVQLQASF
jgi:hypothetical protein